jgi:hypothetical protein
MRSHLVVTRRNQLPPKGRAVWPKPAGCEAFSSRCHLIIASRGQLAFSKRGQLAVTRRRHIDIVGSSHLAFPPEAS